MVENKSMAVWEELERMVRRDLREVIDAEYERIASIYRGINKLCLDVDVVRINSHVEVQDLQRVEHELPFIGSVYFIFSGGRVVKVNVWRYDVVVVGDGHSHVIAIIEVVMFGDRCFISKDVDEYELQGAVNEIVSDLMQGLWEDESQAGV